MFRHMKPPTMPTHMCLQGVRWQRMGQAMLKMLPKDPRHSREWCANIPASCHVIQEKRRERGRGDRRERWTWRRRNRTIDVALVTCCVSHSITGIPWVLISKTITITANTVPLTGMGIKLYNKVILDTSCLLVSLKCEVWEGGNKMCSRRSQGIIWYH